MSEKILLVYFSVESIDILVPKKRGEGFLKVPLGHHACDLSTFTSEHISFDVFGLDGMLSVQTGYISQSQYAELEESVVKPLSAFYNYPYKIVSHEEFWSHHPLAK